MRKLISVALVCSFASASAANAQAPKQSAPTQPTMKCAAYLQSEAASGWSGGVTAQPSADEQKQKSAQLRDFCAGHPDSTIAEAEQAGTRTR